MPLDPKQVALAMSSGLSFVCATCTKYWRARALGIPGQDCLAAVTATPCAGPLAGLDYPAYEGPLAEFERFCFVCSRSAVSGLRARGSPRVFGVCERHGPEWLRRTKPVGAAVVQSAALSTGGAFIELSRIPIRKTPEEHMEEVGAELAKRAEEVDAEG